jgi:hypothetical protein
MRVVATLWIRHPVAMTERNRPLAQALQHHDVEFAAFGQIDRRIEAVGGEAGAGANTKA